MSCCFRLTKVNRLDLVGKINIHAFPCFTRTCSNGSLPSHVNNSEQGSRVSKWGYISDGDDIGKQDKDAPGLYHLKTIHLPKQLENNLNKYLRNFPSKILVKDAFKLSKHLQNRGRPTERTWAKYKEAKAARKLQDNANLEATQALERLKLDEDDTTEQSSMTSVTANQNERTKLTKKPKMQEYKVVRYHKREAAAYAADRIPASYGATFRVLHEISKRKKDFKPEALLDFGSGVGTATWAAHEIWKESIKIYQCVDISQDMNQAAEYILRGNDDYRTSHYVPRVYFKEYLPISDKLTYDVVIASYSLSEIPFRKTRRAILENLWRKTNHFLVIVEKGNNEGFDITMDARNLVAENESDEQEDADEEPDSDGEDQEIPRGFVFSPCPHDLICPRSDVNTRDHPCNFEQRVQLSFAQRRTTLKKYGYYNELFSYLVLRKAERTKNDLDWPRILRPVRLRKRHVICNYCSKNGSLQQKTLTRRKDSELYKCVRHRAKWGDMVPLDAKTTIEDKQKETVS